MIITYLITPEKNIVKLATLPQELLQEGWELTHFFVAKHHWISIHYDKNPEEEKWNKILWCDYNGAKKEEKLGTTLYSLGEPGILPARDSKDWRKILTFAVNVLAEIESKCLSEFYYKGTITIINKKQWYVDLDQLVYVVNSSKLKLSKILRGKQKKIKAKITVSSFKEKESSCELSKGNSKKNVELVGFQSLAGNVIDELKEVYDPEEWYYGVNVLSIPIETKTSTK